MADGLEKEELEGDGNPFSFKNFVHTKKHDSKPTLSDERRKEKALHTEVLSSKKKNKFKDVDVPFPDVVAEKSNPDSHIAEKASSDAAEGILNPFSFKSFMAQDVASKKKRVLQIINDEVHEVKVPSSNLNGDQSYRVCGSQIDSSDSDSDSEQNDRHKSAESPKSGSVHYFVASPESSDAQALKLEELSQLKEENEKLRKKLHRSSEAREEQKRKLSSLHKKLAMIEKREADETAALENMVQMVEKSLELTTQRALRAEKEVKLLKTKSVPLASYNELLEAHISTLRVVKEKSRSAAEQMSAAAKNAEQSIKQMLSGVDTLKFVSSQLESIDRITEVPPSTTDS